MISVKLQQTYVIINNFKNHTQHAIMQEAGLLDPKYSLLDPITINMC